MHSFVQNAYDAINMIAVTTQGQEQEAKSQNMKITYQSKLKIEKNPLKNIKVLKATNKNVAKQQKIKQETWAATRTRKSAETTIMQIVTQKCQTGKKKMQKWKQVVIQEIAHELYDIRQLYKKTIKA